MKKIRLAIFMAKNLKTSTGSNNTVLNILNNLNKNKYAASLILIDDLVPKFLKISFKKLQTDKSYIPFSIILKHKTLSRVYNLTDLTFLDLKKLFDIAIVAIYNTFGEDGRILGVLETVGLPYISPDIKTSSLCLDKTLTKLVVLGNGINVPRGFEVHKKNYNIKLVDKKIKKFFGYPVIIKSVSCGASRGVTLVENFSGLLRGLNNAFKFSKEVILEEFIKGKEFSVGVIGHYLNPKALPVVLIKTNAPFFDYESKYNPSKVEEICPAPINKKLTKDLQRIAINAYRAVKATSHSRIDIIVTNKKIYVLEINTFPGLTSASIFPKELVAAGTSLSQFLDHAILKRLNKKNN